MCIFSGVSWVNALGGTEWKSENARERSDRAGGGGERVWEGGVPPPSQGREIFQF